MSMAVADLRFVRINSGWATQLQKVTWVNLFRVENSRCLIGLEQTTYFFLRLLLANFERVQLHAR